MWRVIVVMGALVSAMAMSVASDDPKPTGKSVTSKKVDELKTSGVESQESAIRQVVEAFVKAYNAHDSKGIAELYLPDAQVIDENDNTIQGRSQIETLFATIFEESPENQLEVAVESIRFIGTSLALETGSTTSIAAPGERPEHARYSVLHALKDGKWSMAVVRDMPAEPTHREHLQALAWLVGDWIDESREGIVKTSCRWSDSGSFLLQEIAVHQPGRDVMKVSQRIGWDPLTKRFKAWMFDSEGGYGESLWTATESGWLIKATSVHADGSTASSTNRVEPNGMDRYVFRSADRIVGDQELSPVVVSVVRQAPQPK
ncbi:SgcJ/EcaC family oxidoreductase [Schlesneria paludicola]|uniref:SgcJ/EcaC family oxidoreductase n=1 Tax=Schlesneria paludicola TaxID=360056 RepID=UPI00029B3A05|nr:SgcJ/EcaC family oxidoreductase [Schlesneria paludicola]